MKEYYDEKGKLFTEVIGKRVVPVIIQTLQHIIKGEIYVHPDDRLIDELKHPEQFLAVTSAVVFSQAGEEMYRANFFSINKDHIVWVMPDQEVTKIPENLKEGY